MRTLKRHSLILVLILYSGVPAARAAGGVQTGIRSTEKGFFALGVFGGLGASRFLNSDGSYTGYKTNLLGADLDVLLWDPGVGDIRLMIRHQTAKSAGRAGANETIQQKETVFGLKFYAGSHLYLSGSMGSGESDLKSADNGTSLHMSYDVMRAAMGLEFGLSESWFLALEGDYRSAPIRKNKSPTITQNTYFEGIGGVIRLIWSPPSVTMTYSGK